MSPVSKWPEQKWSWALLCSSALILLVTALYFQHGMGLQPCVQCVYQRIAVLLLAIFTGIAWLKPESVAYRAVGYTGWLASAGYGLYVAHHHVWLQTAANPLFASCSPYPNFPSWLPLHEWIPFFFGAGGLCTDYSWQFLGMVMSEWMRIIFAFYVALALVILGVRLIKQRRF